MYIQLPSEIIHQIVRSLGPSSDDDDYQDFKNHDCWDIESMDPKKGLARCSLTCRYWAVAVRSVLFNSLILRSADDLAQLVAFLDHPILAEHPLSPLIEDVGIELNGSPQQPWLHHLPTLSKRLLPNVCKWRDNIDCSPDVFLFNIRIVGDVGSGKKHAHCLPFSSLPRSLPHMYAPVHYLRLEDLRLRRHRDLARLVSGYPKSLNCKIRRITFELPDVSSLGAMMPGRRRRTEVTRPWSMDIAVSECGDSRASVRLAMSLAARDVMQHFTLDGRAWEAACQAISSYVLLDHMDVDIMKIHHPGMFYAYIAFAVLTLYSLKTE